MSAPLVVHIMTASLAQGDAIGNYVLTLRRLFTEFGCRVKLYADHIAPQLRWLAYPSIAYHPTGRDILWYHYSIYADNLALVQSSTDYRVMDFHGVTPPHLFAGYDAHMERLCRLATQALPSLREHFDLCVVHSEYSRGVLQARGFSQIEKLPLIVDTDRYGGQQDEGLAELLEGLSYLLIVGRLVPQKDILAMLEIFHHVRARLPEAALLLVGGRDLVPAYQREIDQRIDRLGLKRWVLCAGQISDPAMLTGLFRHACFTLITSEWESFCVPVVESMTFDTPVVIHRVPPLPEVAGEAGIVIDKGQPVAAAERICAAWTHEEEYGMLRRACQRRASNFTIDALRLHLLTMLRRVFGKSK
jgi:glycosyltransferase involved in cell wall biosynthesis